MSEGEMDAIASAALIPQPGVIRDRLEAIKRERAALQRLLRLAQIYHGDGQGAPAGVVRNEPMKLETKGG